MGTWLRGIRVEDGRLRVPGIPEGHSADVTLSMYGIELRAETPVASAATELDWDEYGWDIERYTPKPDGWVVSEWIAYRDLVGVGISAEGVCRELTESVRRVTATTRNRLKAFCCLWGRPFEAVPLLAAGGWSDGTAGRERDTFAALCLVLAQRESLRPRLEDTDVLRRLANDLATQRRRAIPETMGLRVKTMEIVWAMRALGYEHTLLGRPVAGDELPSLEEATDRVAGRLAADPYARSMNFRREYIESVIKERYLLVKPWPFYALTQ